MASQSAQHLLTIDAIREDVVVLKDGGMRIVLMCSSLNFALKSGDEQEAITYQFQNFLNSLDFSLQFIIHSRHLQIAPYIETLREIQKKQENDLMKIQTAEYIEFIRSFVDLTSIMSKTFYVVIPFTPPILEQSGFMNSMMASVGLGAKTSEKTKEAFGEFKGQLWQRAETVVAGLQSFGVRAAPLNTEELIELYYSLYNPSEFDTASAQSQVPQI